MEEIRNPLRPSQKTFLYIMIVIDVIVTPGVGTMNCINSSVLW